MGILQTRVDDLDGTTLPMDHEPTLFTWKGLQYKLDLAPKNEKQFEAALKRFLLAAEIVDGEAPAKVKAPAPTKTVAEVRVRPLNEVFLDTQHGRPNTYLFRNPEHQLADNRGYVSVGRKLLVENCIGSLDCFWCGKTLVANPAEATSTDFVVSYLDLDTKNVSAENVVASHHGCNLGFCSSMRGKGTTAHKILYQNMIDLHRKTIESRNK